jgi:hypothetical protein
MPNIFLGGSRSIVELPAPVEALLNGLTARQHSFILGDAPGADTAFQHALLSRSYQHVTIYHSGASCRTNIGKWPRQSIPAPYLTGRDFYAAKDCALAKAADEGVMLWNGSSPGTLFNAARLIALGKQCFLFTPGQQRFTRITDQSSWLAFFKALPPDLVGKLFQHRTGPDLLMNLVPHSTILN